MGFWDACCRAWNGVKEVARTVATGIVETGRAVVRTVKAVARDIKEAFNRKPPNSDKVAETCSGGGQGNSSQSTTGHRRSTSSRSREVASVVIARGDVIAEYQARVNDESTKRETIVIDAYRKFYSEYVDKLKKVLDGELIKTIEGFIDTTAGKMKNTMRDEVNEEVNPSNDKWKMLLSSSPTPGAVKKYCDDAFYNASKNLLGRLEQSIKDTNKEIRKRVNEYNEGVLRARKDMSDSLKNLTADEETKAKELKKIAEELAVTQFIVNETSVES